MHDRELRIGKESLATHDGGTSFPKAGRFCALDQRLDSFIRSGR